MGLTIYFELRLPADTSRADAALLLSRLREVAASTEMPHVSPVVDLAIDNWATDGDTRAARGCIDWFAQSLVDPMRPHEDGAQYDGDPASAIGFRVDPGDGAETATFALMRRHQIGSEQEEWYWWCACKTQYASVVSDEHFVKVHLGIVAVLDAAIELGFGVGVTDETGYWETRSTEVMLAELARMNHLIARLAGAISDAGHDVKAPIFEHRSFERLEMGE